MSVPAGTAPGECYCMTDEGYWRPCPESLCERKDHQHEPVSAAPERDDARARTVNAASIGSIRFRRERGTTPRPEDVDYLLAENARLVADLDAAEREREVLRIKGLLPEDALRYFNQRNELADCLVATEKALRVALDCKGHYGAGKVSESGGEPAICRECQAVSLAALEARVDS